MASRLEAAHERGRRPDEVALSLEDVSMTFGAPDASHAVRALEHINLQIRSGAFVSLIGPSGCGKSTLLRLLGDLLAPTAGTIRVNGRSPREARLAREYRIVFQPPVLSEWRTVTQNVQLPLEVMRVRADERRQPRGDAAGPGRADRVCRSLPLGVVRGHAAAREHRPRAIVQAIGQEQAGPGSALCSRVDEGLAVGDRRSVGCGGLGDEVRRAWLDHGRPPGADDV
jgi:ABC-type glutathione transport system ATPase component